MTRTARTATVVALILAMGAAIALLPVQASALALVEWLRGAGFMGALIFVVAYVVAAVLLLPGSILTLGAGFAYGPLVGLLVVSPASVLASTAAFLLGRTLARDWVACRIDRDPRFAAVDRAIGQSGFSIVLLLRLSPIFPYSLTNYALGLTGVRLRDYVLASWIGMLPGTFLFVYLGSLVTTASQVAQGAAISAGPWRQAFYWFGLAATVLVVAVVTRIARRGLREALDQPANL